MRPERHLVILEYQVLRAASKGEGGRRGTVLPSPSLPPPPHQLDREQLPRGAAVAAQLAMENGEKKEREKKKEIKRHPIQPHPILPILRVAQRGFLSFGVPHIEQPTLEKLNSKSLFSCADHSPIPASELQLHSPVLVPAHVTPKDDKGLFALRKINLGSVALIGYLMKLLLKQEKDYGWVGVGGLLFSVWVFMSTTSPRSGKSIYQASPLSVGPGQIIPFRPFFFSSPKVNLLLEKKNRKWFH